MKPFWEAQTVTMDFGYYYNVCYPHEWDNEVRQYPILWLGAKYIFVYETHNALSRKRLIYRRAVIE